MPDMKDVTKKQTFPKATIAYVAVIIAIVGIGGAFIRYDSSSQTGVSTSTIAKQSWLTFVPSANTTTATSSGVRSDNLDLAMNLSASSITSGQYVSINLWEVNSLSTPNTMNVPVNSSTSIPSLSFPAPGMQLAPCPDPFMPAIYQGYYTASNISQASALMLYFTLGASCPATHYASSYTFSSASDSILLNNEPNTGVNSLSINGYFQGTTSCQQDNNTVTATCPAFHSFPAGTYTIAGGDTWGALDILYLTVVS